MREKRLQDMIDHHTSESDYSEFSEVGPLGRYRYSVYWVDKESLPKAYSIQVVKRAVYLVFKRSRVLLVMRALTDEIGNLTAF